MALTLGQAVIELAANTVRFNTALERAHSDFNKFTDAIRRGAEAVGIAFGTLELAKFTRETAALGLEAQVQEDAFNRLTKAVGASGEALAHALQRASGDIINISDVMLAASRGLTEGFQPDQLIRLMELARQAAKLMGTDVTTAFDQITRAIANQQTRALKPIFGDVDAERAVLEYATALGKTTEELTSAGRAQALYNAVIAKSKETISALATQERSNSEDLQRWSAQWKQVREDVGKFLVDEGVGLLRMLEETGRAVSTGINGPVRELGGIWAEAWSGAKKSMEPIVPILRDVIVPFLKLAGVAVAGFATSSVLLQQVLAGPLAFIGSLLDDLASNKWPSYSSATRAADQANLEAQRRTDELLGKLKAYADGVQPATEATKDVGKAVEDLGKNKLGAMSAQVRAAILDLTGFSKALLGISEQAARQQQPEQQQKVEEVLQRAIEPLRTMKGLTVEALAAMENALRPWAESIVAATADLDLMKQATEAVEQSIEGVARDLVDEAGIWSKLGQAIHDAAIIAEATGDSTGGLTDKIKAAEQALGEAIKRFGSGSEQARAFADRLAELRQEFESLEANAFTSSDQGATGTTKDLLDQAAIWSKLGQAMDKARTDGLAVGDSQKTLARQVEAAAEAVGDAARRFGEGSEEVEAFRDRYHELLDQLRHEEELQRAVDIWVEYLSTQRLIKAETEVFGSTFDRLGATMSNLRETITALLREGIEPTDPALKDLIADYERLSIVGDVFDSINQTVTQSVRGVLQGTQSVSDAFRNLGQNLGLSIIESAVKRLLQSLENMMVEFITSETVKAFIKLIISFFSSTGSTTGSSGFGTGNVGVSGTAGHGLVALAGGGVVKRPTMALIGEAGPEAVVPLNRPGGLGANVTVQIINQTSTPITATQQDAIGPDGERMLRIFLRNEVNNGLGEGAFDKALKGSFGIRRAGISR